MKKLFYSLTFLFFSTISFLNVSIAANPDDLLKPDIAFQGSLSQTSEDRIKATWKIADGYYMYRKRFSFKSEHPDISLSTPIFPKGILKEEPGLGKVEIYRNNVSIEIPIIRNNYSNPDILAIKTVSQGCADIGVCYPPQKKTFSLQLATSEVTSKTNSPSKTLSSTTLNLAQELGITGIGNNSNAPLPPDKAFAFDLTAVDNKTLNAYWNITPGHYLYQHKIKFNLLEPSDAVSLGKPELPKGKAEHDEYFGNIISYNENFDVKIPVIGSAESVTVKTTYQGCSKLTGICYPPQYKTQTVKLTSSSDNVKSATSTRRSTAIDDNSVSALKQTNDISFDNPQEKFSTGNKWLDNALNSDSIWWIFFAALGAGLVLAFTACMYPMIPILSSIIVGQGENVSAFKGFILSAIYVFALALTFGVVGALTASFASGVGIQAYFQNPWVLSIFALMFILLAFSMFGFYDIQVPAGLQNKLSAISNKQKGGTFIGVGIMGALSALIIGPCGGPALAAMLTYAAASSSVFNGFIAMFALGLGMGLPLLLVGAGGGKLLPKAGNWMTAVKAGAGVVLLAVSLIILERMPSLYSPLLTMMLWSALLIVSGVYLGAFNSILDKNGWFKFWKGLGLFLIFYGVLVMIGGLLGGKTVTDPFHDVLMSSSATTGATNDKTHVQFKRIKSIEDLKQNITQAKQQNKIVMLDFYADWCTYCIKYERYIFPQVKTTLNKLTLLQADVTAMDKTDTELMKALGVSLPPAILFFGKDGKEIPSSRIVGEMNVDEFSKHLKKHLKLLLDQ